MVSQAIKAALEGDWNLAIILNKKLIKTEPENCEALNRLAQAYKSVGQNDKAVTHYKKVVRIDKYNKIALRNLEVLKNCKSVKSQQTATAGNITLNSDLFLEEVGKTKLISLINLAPSSRILSISPMQSLTMEIKRKSIFITDNFNNYLGALPDDLSYRLIKFLNAGYKYECLAKSIEKNNLHVLLRETVRSKKLNNQPTFPLGNNEHDYLVINAPDVSVSQQRHSDKNDNFQPKELNVESDAEETSNDTDDDDD